MAGGTKPTGSNSKASIEALEKRVEILERRGTKRLVGGMLAVGVAVGVYVWQNLSNNGFLAAAVHSAAATDLAISTMLNQAEENRITPAIANKIDQKLKENKPEYLISGRPTFSAEDETIAVQLSG